MVEPVAVSIASASQGHGRRAIDVQEGAAAAKGHANPFFFPNCLNGDEASTIDLHESPPAASASVVAAPGAAVTANEQAPSGLLATLYLLLLLAPNLLFLVVMVVISFKHTFLH